MHSLGAGYCDRESGLVTSVGRVRSSKGECASRSGVPGSMREDQRAVGVQTKEAGVQVG